MANKLRLSIIIPVYNVEPYITETIESCLNQDIPVSDYELICIDDGSTDNSLNVLKNLAAQYSNIKIYSKANGGVSQTRNYGIEKALAEYIWFVDGDDVIAPNCLNALLDFAEKEQADILGFKLSHFFDHPVYDIRPIKNSVCRKRDELYSFMFSIGGGGVCVNFYRTALLRDSKIRFNEHMKYSEDVLFHFSVLLKANKCAKTDAIIYHYRQRQGSAMHSAGNSDKFIESMRLLSDEYDSLLKQETDSQWRNIILGNRNRAVRALLFALVRSGNVGKTRECIDDLKQKQFYPYPITPKALVRNETFTQFLINLFSLLFPVRIYTMTMVRIFNLIKK